MTGTRLMLFLAIVALVVGGVPSTHQQLVQFDFVQIDLTLRIMRTEVSVAQWRQCFEEKACGHMPRSGLGAIDDQFPVTDVNWFDVEEFIVWAKRRSGLEIRLPTAMEWQKASHIKFVGSKLLFEDPRLAWAAEYSTEPKVDPVLQRAGHFGVTAEGVTDFRGNVWEWTMSCAGTGFAGNDGANCPAYKVLGEHEATLSVFARDPAAGGCSTGVAPAHVGFRLVY